MDRFDVPGIAGDVSVIDAAICIFVRVEDVGIDPQTGVEELQADRASSIGWNIRATISHDIDSSRATGEMKVRVNPLLFAVARDHLQGAEQCRRKRTITFFPAPWRGALSKAHPGTG